MSTIPFDCAQGDAPSVYLPCAPTVALAPADDSVDTNNVDIVGHGTISSFGPAPLAVVGAVTDADGNVIYDDDGDPTPVLTPVAVTKRVTFTPSGGSIVLQNGANLQLLGFATRTIANPSVGTYSCTTAGVWSELYLQDMTTAGGGGGAPGPPGPGYLATSTTSLVIGTGAKSFATQTGLAYTVGARARAASHGAPANFMEGLVTAYAGASMTITADLLGGSGTFADWDLNIAGEQGTQGPIGNTGATGAQGPIGNTGPAGATGAPGATGPQGPIGNTGSTGPAGSTGAPGAPGATGPQGAGYQATSTTSLAIGTGSKTFTTQAGLAYTVGARARAASNSAPTNWMEGQVTAYSGTSLTINADLTNGAGTLADWNINVAGVQGSTGATGSTGSTGAPGAPGAAGSTGPAGAGYAATSTTSLAVATGSQTFATQAGLAYSIGARVRAASAGAPTAWMEGLCTAYAGTSLTLNVDLTNGSGTHADWNINLAGQQGAVGATGPGTPAAVVLEVSLAANQTGVVSGAWTVCKYDTKVTDTQSAYNTATGVFTPTQAGLYAVSATVAVYQPGSGAALGIAIAKNGVRTTGESQTSHYNAGTTIAGQPISISGLIFCNGTTDTISVLGMGGSTTFYSSTAVGVAVNMVATLLQSGPAGPQGIQGPAGTPGTPGTVPIAANIALEVALNANQTGLTAGAWNALKYDTIVTDTQGGAYNTTTGVYTPKQAGVYAVSASLAFNVVTNSWAGVGILKNGSFTAGESQINQDVVGAYASANGAFTATALIFCNGTTDTISVQGRLSTNTTFLSSANAGFAVNMIAVLMQTGPQGAAGATGAPGAGYLATSTTSLTIGTGPQTFTTQSGLAYTVGARARLASTASPAANFMEGVVTAYSGTSMTIGVDTINGSGTLAAWDLNIAGQPGPTPGVTATAPTVQKITASGAYTYTPSAGVKWCRIKAAASGGGGSSTAGAAAGGTAGALTLVVGGVTALTLGGGTGASSISGGNGGAVTLGTVPGSWAILFSAVGGDGSNGATYGPYGMGGAGGVNMFGGGGGGGGQAVGTAGKTGTGAGGGGGGWGGNSQQAQGAGGGAGACAEIIVSSPGVITGTLGNFGAGTAAGGQYNGAAGGLGGIYIEEHYNW